jgi:hypothetical protein
MRMTTNRKRVIAVLFALGLAIGAAAWFAISDANNSAVAQPGGAEGGKAAENDEEWIDLIKTAERVRAGEIPAPALPSVEVPRGATLLKSCEWLPTVFHASGAANQPGPIPGTGRTVLHITDVSERGDGPEYVLVVDWKADLSKCDSRVRAVALSAVDEQAAIDQHICEQMQLSAEEKPLTDPTFRTPSKRVAEAYLRAFC